MFFYTGISIAVCLGLGELAQLCRKGSPLRPVKSKEGEKTLENEIAGDRYYTKNFACINLVQKVIPSLSQAVRLVVPRIYFGFSLDARLLESKLVTCALAGEYQNLSANTSEHF
ncbi:hypothetical protein C8Q75DRAFT_13530 [Abortiporus biennis]|nr:hypothetical protein C8Q75DRAFT_13530 [Abortiporus biennis]